MAVTRRWAPRLHGRLGRRARRALDHRQSLLKPKVVRRAAGQDRQTPAY
jgi:hypothetical protein